MLNHFSSEIHDITIYPNFDSVIQIDTRQGNVGTVSGVTKAIYKGLSYIGRPDLFNSIIDFVQLSEKILDQPPHKFDRDLIKFFIKKPEDHDNSDDEYGLEKSGEPIRHIFYVFEDKEL